MAMTQGLGSGSGLTAEKEEAIRRAAAEEGVDPAYMLAVAERESSFNTRDHASKTIFGAFQMTRGLRQTYGGADFDTDDMYKQAKMFARYTKQEVAPPMRQILGREPTPEEIYVGHHAGPGRAARMLSTVNPQTPVQNIFTPYELSLNPHIVRAGTSGAFTSRTVSDMNHRMARYTGGGSSIGSAPDDLAQYGVAAGGMPAPAQEDFAKYGVAAGGMTMPQPSLAATPVESVLKPPPAAPEPAQPQTASTETTSSAGGGIPEVSVPSLVRGIKNWWNQPSPS